MASLIAAALAVDDVLSIYEEGWQRVTCKLAYYAQFEPNGTNHADIRLIAATAGRTDVDESSVKGVVMEVVTPTNLAGQIISMYLDPPAVFSGGVRFKPGVVYAGKWRTGLIGKLGFMGEVAFFPVDEPPKLKDPDVLQMALDYAREQRWDIKKVWGMPEFDKTQRVWRVFINTKQNGGPMIVSIKDSTKQISFRRGE